MSVVCFRQAVFGRFNESYAFPCGNLNTTDPTVACCNSGDFCMQDGLCHYTHSLLDGSGYYVGSCTASNGTGPGCPNKCNDQNLPDAVYDRASGLWRCCGTDESDQATCSQPTNETFTAPATDELQVVFSVPAEGWTATSTAISSSSSTTIVPESSTAASSTSAETTPVATASPSPSPASSGLSSGAAAGIGVGAALLVLVAVALVAWLFLRHRKQRRWTSNSNVHTLPDQRTYIDDATAGSPKAGSHELDKRAERYELDRQDRPQELGSGGWWERTELSGAE